MALDGGTGSISLHHSSFIAVTRDWGLFWARLARMKGMNNIFKIKEYAEIPLVSNASCHRGSIGFGAVTRAVATL